MCTAIFDVDGKVWAKQSAHAAIDTVEIVYDDRGVIAFGVRAL
jgi:hypothetical protein